jgi:aminomethyltransferase
VTVCMALYAWLSMHGNGQHVRIARFVVGLVMGHRTPLYALHQEAGARLVDFAGWDMPLNYGSQIEEHHAVRQGAGVFDVSHMTIIAVTGTESQAFLDKVLANDITRLQEPGKALYSAMLDTTGHVLDDLIVYLLADGYLMVVNCATREKDLDWLQQHSNGMDCELLERADLAILAVQGPDAISSVKGVVDAGRQSVIDSLKVFQGAWCDDWFIARTGYTGEKGLEIMLPGASAQELWQRLLSAGVKPIGLGARDTLRLEAGMNLYGNDMDETVSPYESNMANTVVLEERNFIGGEALRRAKGKRTLVGLVLNEKGVLRSHYPVFSDDREVGEITSGAYSPTLEKSIAFARVDSTRGSFSAEIRGKRLPVELVHPPFVRNGKQVYKAWQENI